MINVGGSSVLIHPFNYQCSTWYADSYQFNSIFITSRYFLKWKFPHQKASESAKLQLGLKTSSSSSPLNTHFSVSKKMKTMIQLSEPACFIQLAFVLLFIPANVTVFHKICLQGTQGPHPNPHSVHQFLYPENRQPTTKTTHFIFTILKNSEEC